MLGGGAKPTTQTQAASSRTPLMAAGCSLKAAICSHAAVQSATCSGPGYTAARAACDGENWSIGLQRPASPASATANTIS